MKNREERLQKQKEYKIKKGIKADPKIKDSTILSQEQIKKKEYNIRYQEKLKNKLKEAQKIIDEKKEDENKIKIIIKKK